MVTRNYNWGLELLKRGHDVTIIAASYSHYRNINPETGDTKCKEDTIDGLKYIWLKVKRYDANKSLGRIEAILQFQWHLSRLIKTLPHDYDIVIASSPQPFQIYQAKKIADKCRAKLIYDIRDLWPLTLIKIADMSKWHPFIQALQHAEDYACRHADLITSVPQNARHYLSRRGMKPDKFLPIGNGYIEKDRKENEPLLQSHSELLKRLKSDNKFIIGYCGTLGRANAMHTAIQALAHTSDEIHLVLLGDGHQKANLQSLASELNVAERIHFLSPVPHNQVHNFLSNIDVAYIGAMYSRLYKYGASPAKMNDYLAAAKPVLYTIGDPNNPVEKSGCGVSCRAEDSEQIALAVNKMASMSKKDLNVMGKKGHQWLMINQTVEKQIDAILEKLK
jgi:glycosyltransferase involved in cell wall biosynthesis